MSDSAMAFWYGLMFVVIVVVAYGPAIWILASRRSRGLAKLGWFLLAICLPLIGLAAFLIVTQSDKSRQES